MFPGTRCTLRNDAAAMFLVLLCYQAVLQVLSKERPPPPLNVRVDQWEMTWDPATEDSRNTTYTIQYCSSDNNCTKWKAVPACTQISSNSCNVTLPKAEVEHACVRLRVQTESQGSFSKPVNACRINEDTCTPEVSLTARPNSLTIHLRKNPKLDEKHAGFAKHRVYFGKEGHTLEEHSDTDSSMSINDLEAGQRYCTRVEYVIYDNPVGLASCIQCEDIPFSKDSTKTAILVPGLLFILVTVIAVSAYVYIFQRKKIKQWLQPQYEIPQYLLEPLPARHISIPSTGHNEEGYNVLSSITRSSN